MLFTLQLLFRAPPPRTGVAPLEMVESTAGAVEEVMTVAMSLLLRMSVESDRGTKSSSSSSYMVNALLARSSGGSERLFDERSLSSEISVGSPTFGRSSLPVWCGSSRFAYARVEK
jgi:hypothetical protein